MEMFNRKKRIQVIKLDHCNPYGIIILDGFHHQITLPWTNISHPWWHFLKMTVLFLRVGHVSSLEGRSKTWDAKSELFGTNQLEKKPSLLGVPNNFRAALFKPWKIFTTYPPCIGVFKPFFWVNGGNGWVAGIIIICIPCSSLFCGIRDSTKTGELTQGGPLMMGQPKKKNMLSSFKPSDVSKAKKAPTCAGLAWWKVSPLDVLILKVPRNRSHLPQPWEFVENVINSKKMPSQGWYTLED